MVAPLEIKAPKKATRNQGQSTPQFVFTVPHPLNRILKMLTTLSATGVIFIWLCVLLCLYIQSLSCASILKWVCLVDLTGRMKISANPLSQWLVRTAMPSPATTTSSELLQYTIAAALHLNVRRSYAVQWSHPQLYLVVNKMWTFHMLHACP